MEKELEVERERDKARNTRIMEAKLSEPPPKVAVSFHVLFVFSYTQLQQHIRANSQCILFTPPSAFQSQY